MSTAPKPSAVARWILFGLFCLVIGGAFLLLAKTMTPASSLRKIDGYTAWPKEIRSIAETIPVQDGGRIKPFSTYASFTMLRLHGQRTMKIEDGQGKKLALKPTDWLLDCLFRPDKAAAFPTFRLDNSAVIDAIGLKSGEKRDRYSYNDLIPAREKLIELAKSYEKIEADKRDPMQQQTIDFAYNIRSFESLIGYLGWARVQLRMQSIDGSPERTTDLSTMMAALPQVRQFAGELHQKGQQIPDHVMDLLAQIQAAAEYSSDSLFLFPPSEGEGKWHSVGDEITRLIRDENPNPGPAIADLKMLETTSRAVAKGDDAFRAELTKLRDSLVERAKAKGAYRAIELEASYNRADWFLNAFVFFLIGCFLVVGAMFFGKWFARVAWLFIATGGVLCVVAIVQRCLIMQRPPVGNLYDTIIFICAVLVVFALFLQWVTRRRFALAIGAFGGAALILLARKFELGDAKDHMDPLVAVLNSNYWLTIHVITITVGYASGILTALLSVVYVLLRCLGLMEDDRNLRRSLTRATYGFVCLTLFLSLVGTVLGGIWANDSWGRFWGWDPKENGALMIVLWNLAILHARLGGYIRERGLHIASLLGACVVVFSWWHVNFFNTGLHNYGFTSGKTVIWFVYGAFAVVAVLGLFAPALEKLWKPKEPVV
jgi:ABC-type transport system involved in cytochrome c biogenesis permease subunit